MLCPSIWYRHLRGGKKIVVAFLLINGQDNPDARSVAIPVKRIRVELGMIMGKWDANGSNVSDDLGPSAHGPHRSKPRM